MKLYEIKNNQQFNSLEIYFTAKPDEATREALKGLKFRWNPKKACWYGFADVAKVNEALNNEKSAVIPESSFVDGGGLYDGWEGGNNHKWNDDKELKALLLADFKKAGIKATIRFNRAGYLTSITTTMQIQEDEIKTYQEYREGFNIPEYCSYWLDYEDENGNHKDIHKEKFYTLEAEEQKALEEKIAEYSYKRAVDRLTCSGCSHSDANHILKESAAKRFELLRKIISSYNRDCTNTMVDYFDRDIYDDYCFKIA